MLAMYEVNADIQARYTEQLRALVKSALDFPGIWVTDYLWQSDPKLSLIIVDEHTDTVQGVLLANEESMDGIWGKGSVYIRLFAVRPDAQGRGIGTRLLTALKTICKERCFLSMWLHTMDNGRTEPFYKKRGFSTILRDPEFYETEPTTGLVMVCPLETA
jgi:ribosomal protein S18 acetylase RimI-like enzyme